MIRVAIVDDGVKGSQYKSFPEIRHYVVEESLCIETTAENKDDYNESKSHGTLCADIIDSFNVECELISVNILDEMSQCGSIEKLLTALQWCLQNDIQIINLSLGTIYYEDFILLDETLKALADAGIIMVAAANNNNRIAFPAASNYVIGVRYDCRSKLNPGSYFYAEKAIDGIQVILGADSNYIFNSLAAPRITGMIMEWMAKGILKPKEIFRKIKETSVNSEYYNSQAYIYDYFNSCSSDSVPVVLIMEGAELGLSGKLKKFFRETGYNCIELYTADSADNYADGVISIRRFIDKSITLNSLLQIYNNLFIPDLILINVDFECKYILTSLKEEDEVDVIIDPERKLQLNCDEKIKLIQSREYTNIKRRVTEMLIP